MNLKVWLWNTAQALVLGLAAAGVYIAVAEEVFRGPNYTAAACLGAVISTLFGVGLGYRAGVSAGQEKN